jgi:hypothetical protein
VEYRITMTDGCFIHLCNEMIFAPPISPFHAEGLEKQSFAARDAIGSTSFISPT